MPYSFTFLAGKLLDTKTVMDLEMSEDDSEEDFGEYADVSEDEAVGNGTKANGGSEDEEDSDDVAESNWGKRRSAYHKTRDESDDDSDEEDIAEQKEAQRLQRLKAQSRREDDFDDSFAARSASAASKKNDKKTKLTSTDAGLLETMYKEMGNFQSTLTADVDSLTRQEKMELISKDSPELLLLLDSFNANMQEIRDRLAPLIERARAQHIPTSKGMSYLEIKYHLLLNYCTNICFYLLLKAEGQSVKNHPVIEHLARTRTVIDRLKPLDQKLKYQIDKLLKVAAQGEANIQSDPKLSHRANIKGFMPVGKDEDASDDGDSMDGIEDDEDVEDDEMGAGSSLGARLDKYVAPKFAPTGDREEKRRLRAEKKAKSSAMAEYMIDEFGDRPREHSLSTGPREKSLREAASERARYEEDNFVRLGLTKKEKKAARAAAATQFVDEFADLADYGDLKALDRADALHQADDLEDRAFSAKRKRGGKGDDDVGSKSSSSRVSAILGDIDARAEASAAAKAHRYSQAADDDIDYESIAMDKKAKRQKLKDDREKAEAQHAIDAERRAMDLARQKDVVDVSARSKKSKRTEYADDAAAFDDDDDFYKEAVATQEAAKADRLATKRAERSGRKADKEAREAEARAEREAFDALPADGKRKASKEIEINRGLRKTKKKELRNSRVKLKNRYEEALHKLKSRGATEVHTGKRRYDGASGNVNSRLVTSTQL